MRFREASHAGVPSAPPPGLALHWQLLAAGGLLPSDFCVVSENCARSGMQGTIAIAYKNSAAMAKLGRRAVRLGVDAGPDNSSLDIKRKSLVRLIE